MSQYNRIDRPRASYFFTVVTHDRRPWLQSERNMRRLREAFMFVRSRRPFSLDAIVVLPDHLHCIWTIKDDPDFSARWRMIKTHFSRYMRTTPDARGRKRVWQPRFRDHIIRDESDYRRHLHYIHFNPVKHGYVSQPSEWPYSSFLKFVRLGWYDRDWGTAQPKLIGDMELE